MMIEQMSRNLADLKRELVGGYGPGGGGGGGIQEIIPVAGSDSFPVEEKHLELLRLFVSKNRIYHSSYEKDIAGTRCTVYEGDINRYWLGSIDRESSRAPFSPTWMMSAFVAALQARQMGFREVVDVGSGDGRIAYCAKVLGLASHSLEIDEDLVGLQKSIISGTGLDFGPNCADVTEFDFGRLGLERPVFFIGGLAQMGGSALASSIIDSMDATAAAVDAADDDATATTTAPQNLKGRSGFVFAGTYLKKYPESEHEAGWGKLIEKNNLRVAKVLQLPTAWTLGESEDTPYIFAGFDV